MIKSITILFLVLALFGSSFSAEDIKEKMKEYEHQSKVFKEKVNKIESDSLKQKLYGIAMSLFVQEMTEISKQMFPNNTNYITDPNFLLNNYNSYKDLANNYIDGQILFYFDNRESKYTVSTSEAFKYPFKINTTWREAIFDNQEVYPILPENTGKSPTSTNNIQVFESGKWTFPKSIYINYPTQEKSPVPIKIRANVYTELPTAIHQFHFLKKDIGTIQSKDDISVKLLQIENSYVEIEVTTSNGFRTNSDACGQYDWLKIAAKDKTGQFISMKSASNYKGNHQEAKHNLYQELTAQESYTPEFLHSFFEKAEKIRKQEKVDYEARDENKHYRFQMFTGIVDEIYVDIYDYSTPQIISREVTYRISDFRNLITLGDFKEIQTTATVYDDEATAMFNKGYDLSVDELETQIAINQKPPLISKGAVVNFEYPKLASSALCVNRFSKLKELSFLNKNERPIPISPDSIGYHPNTERDYLVDFTMSRIDYRPERFPEIPYYVIGTFEVNLVNIEKQVYRSDNLPFGILIKNNAVLLDQNTFNKTEYEIFVKDSTNRYLKRIQKYTGAVNLNGERSNTYIHYYYGAPQIIEIYKLKDLQKVDYKFNVKLTREVISEQSLMWY